MDDNSKLQQIMFVEMTLIESTSMNHLESSTRKKIIYESQLTLLFLIFVDVSSHSTSTLSCCILFTVYFSFLHSLRYFPLLDLDVFSSL